MCLKRSGINNYITSEVLMTKNALCHIEWSSTDLDRSERFFNGLFGWEFNKHSVDYYMYDSSDGVGGGLMKVEKVEPGSSPVIYFCVDKIKPYLEKVTGLGGSVKQGKTSIPDYGFYALLEDPDGNLVGLFKSKD